jgi:MFS family permease
MNGETAIAGRGTPFYGWRMVALVFVILNFALGVNFTAYGSLVEAIQREFGTSRALAVSGPSVLTLAMGLLAPFAGSGMRRVPLKTLMLVGVVMNAAGYVIITQVHSIALMLACYALLIGPGFCLIGVIPCTTIVSNWFVEGRGRAIGIINMPFGNTLMPLVAALLLQSFGLRATFLACGILLAALIPLILALVDRPERIGQSARGAAILVEEQIPPTAMSTAQILRFKPFWILTLGVGLLSAGGMVMVSHLVALGMGRGLALPAASLLLAGFGVAGVAGAPIFGWLSDRLGGGRAFAILCLAQVPGWLGLIVAGDSLPLLLMLAMLIGLCSNAIMTLFGTTTGEWLGPANISAGMGLCYLLQIPFLFGAAPLAGAMFDATGSYTATILLHASSFVAMAAIFLLYRPKPAVIAFRPSVA